MYTSRSTTRKRGGDFLCPYWKILKKSHDFEKNAQIVYIHGLNFSFGLQF